MVYTHVSSFVKLSADVAVNLINTNVHTHSTIEVKKFVHSI